MMRWGVKGGLRERYEDLRRQIINAMAIVEALIDFGEDDGVGEEVYLDGSSLLLFFSFCLIKIELICCVSSSGGRRVPR